MTTANIAAVIAYFLLLPLIPAVIVSLVGFPLLEGTAITLYGLWRKRQPLRAFDPAEQRESAASLGGEGRHVITPDGRVVEYIVYGSRQSDARAIVQIHGSGTTAGIICAMNKTLCEELNLIGIAPSLPCHGYSDLHIGRKIAQFPLDIEVILDAEGIDKFMVEGTSFGTPHAMAVAWYFGPQRCSAMGLNVPYLSDQICKEKGLFSTADGLPKPDARTWYQAWNFLVADLMFLAPLLSPPTRHIPKTQAEGKKALEQMPWVFDLMMADAKRLVARGAQGMGWEQFSVDVVGEWGFDPREIQTKSIAVWYAKDDTLVPPPHGEWLAGYFNQREGTHVDIQDKEEGLGHFTYFPSTGPMYVASEQTIPKTLIELNAAQENS